MNVTYDTNVHKKHFIETKINLLLDLISHSSSSLLKMTFLNINEIFVIKTDQFYSISVIPFCLFLKSQQFTIHFVTNFITVKDT